MKTLTDHNREAVTEFVKKRKTDLKSANVSCPKCGSELLEGSWDRTPRVGIVKKDVVCPSCGFTGEKVIS